nr:hypothetical protein Iba_scaffold32072CG0010 [Ipomoea batatas]
MLSKIVREFGDVKHRFTIPLRAASLILDENDEMGSKMVTNARIPPSLMIICLVDSSPEPMLSRRSIADSWVTSSVILTSLMNTGIAPSSIINRLISSTPTKFFNTPQATPTNSPPESSQSAQIFTRTVTPPCAETPQAFYEAIDFNGGFHIPLIFLNRLIEGHQSLFLHLGQIHAAPSEVVAAFHGGGYGFHGAENPAIFAGIVAALDGGDAGEKLLQLAANQLPFYGEDFGGMSEGNQGRNQVNGPSDS